MIIDEKLLERLEKLSALRIADEKKEQIKAELSEILGFVEILNTLDLSKEKPTTNTIQGGTPFRADEAKKSAVIDDVLVHCPATNGHFFIVPKIIE